MWFITYHLQWIMSCDTSHIVIWYIIYLWERRAIGWFVSHRAYRNLTHRQLIPALSLHEMAGKRCCPRGRTKSNLSISDLLNSRANIARRWYSAPMKILVTSVDPFEGISKLRYLDRALWRGLKRPYWRRETSCVSAISSLSSVAGWTSCPTCWCIGTRRWYSRWQVRLRLLTGCLLLGLSIRASTSPPAEEQHTRDRGAQQVQCWHLLRRRWRDLVRATLTARPSDFDHCSNI